MFTRLLLALCLALPTGAIAQAPGSAPGVLQPPPAVAVPLSETEAKTEGKADEKTAGKTDEKKATATAPATPPAPSVTGLTLPAAMTVPAGSGLLEITAQSARPVSFDTFGVFDEGNGNGKKVELQARVVDVYDKSGKFQNTTLYLGIPGVAGAIRIVASVTIDGADKPAIASTTVTIAAADPNPNPNPPPGPGPGPNPPAPGPDNPPPPAPVTPGKLAVTLIGSPDSPGLKAALEKAGHRLFAYKATDAAYLARPDLVAEVRAVGGTPALIITDAAGNLLDAKKLPFTSDALVIELVNRAATGGKGK